MHFYLIIVILIVSLHIDGGEINSAPTLELNQLIRKQAKVLRVVDGNKLRLEINGKERSVLLIGLDCAPTKGDDEIREWANNAQETIVRTKFMADQAKIKLEELCPEGCQVELELATPGMDAYGRVRAFLWQDEKLINFMMLENGMAFVSTETHRYAEPMKLLAEKAKKDLRGLHAYTK